MSNLFAGIVFGLVSILLVAIIASSKIFLIWTNPVTMALVVAVANFLCISNLTRWQIKKSVAEIREIDSGTVAAYLAKRDERFWSFMTKLSVVFGIVAGAAQIYTTTMSAFLSGPG